MPDDAQQVNDQSATMMRGVILTGICAAILLTGFVLGHFQAEFTITSAGSILYIVMCAICLSSYAWLALYRTQVENQMESVRLWLGGSLGLVVALLWILLVSESPPELSLKAEPILIFRIVTLIIPILTTGVALYASYRTNKARTGLWVGIWSGVISALVTYIALLLLAFSGRYTEDPNVLWHAQMMDPIGERSEQGYVVLALLYGAVNHLWIDPAVGSLFGGLGGLIGASLNKRKSLTA